MSAADYIKSHKWQIVGGIVVVGLLYILWRNATASQGADTGSAQGFVDQQSALAGYGMQLQLAQMQANAQVAGDTLKAGVANNQISAELEAAKLQSVNTLAAIGAQREIQLNADTLSAQTTQAVSLLQAQVAEGQIAGQIAMTQINAKAYVDIASLPYTSVTPELVKNVQTLLSTQDAQSKALAADEAKLAALGIQTNTNTGNINSLAAGTQAAINDLNQWSGKYFGGVVAPVSVTNAVQGKDYHV